MLNENFKIGNREYLCSITMPQENVEFVTVHCSHCKKLCSHTIDLATKNIDSPLSNILLQSLWFHSRVGEASMEKVWRIMDKVKITNKERGVIEAIVDGNNETYSIVLEDGEKFCSCVYNRIRRGICYHIVAVLINAIFRKGLSISEAKELMK